MAYRGIVDTVGRSESLAALSHLGERIYWRLLAHSDPYGRVPGSPAKTRALCFPLLDVTAEEVGFALLELATVDRIAFYEVDGQRAIQLVGFEDNQPKEFLRKRGASRIPECPTLKSGTSPALVRSVYKLPANQVESGTSPAQGRSSPSPKAFKALTEVQKATADARASDDPDGPTAAASEIETEGKTLAELVDYLDHWNIGGDLRQRTLLDPKRGLLCARRVEAANASNPGGYLRRLLESGDTPTVPNGAKPISRENVQPKDPIAAIRREITNGVITDLVDLEAELAGYNLTGTQAAELRALVDPGEPPEPPDAVALAELGKAGKR